MMKYRQIYLFAALLLLSSASATAQFAQRQHILVVGSSTTFPIIAAAAEHVGRHAGIMTPVIESTGTGGGLKLFCAGIGLATPDIAMASRSMKASERALCTRNGVHDIREIMIGYDGIVVANAKEAPRFQLNRRDLYLALARHVPAAASARSLVANPYTHWDQIDPSLPHLPIRVLGPPPTSGTRDILAERLLEAACREIDMLRELEQTDPATFTQRCHSLREDGAFVNAGENDARLVRKLLADPDALGIFGYNFVERNRDRLQAASIEGIEPRFELIESGVYPFSRPLYLYVKPAHTDLVNGLDTFVNALLSAEASGAEGYLVDHGLIPLPGKERTRQQQGFSAARDE